MEQCRIKGYFPGYDSFDPQDLLNWLCHLSVPCPPVLPKMAPVLIWQENNPEEPVLYLIWKFPIHSSAMKRCLRCGTKPTVEQRSQESVLTLHSLIPPGCTYLWWGRKQDMYRSALNNNPLADGCSTQVSVAIASVTSIQKPITLLTPQKEKNRRKRYSN